MANSDPDKTQPALRRIKDEITNPKVSQPQIPQSEVEQEVTSLNPELLRRLDRFKKLGVSEELARARKLEIDPDLWGPAFSKYATETGIRPAGLTFIPEFNLYDTTVPLALRKMFGHVDPKKQNELLEYVNSRPHLKEEFRSFVDEIAEPIRNEDTALRDLLSRRGRSKELLDKAEEEIRSQHQLGHGEINEPSDIPKFGKIREKLIDAIYNELAQRGPEPNPPPRVYIPDHTPVVPEDEVARIFKKFDDGNIVEVPKTYRGKFEDYVPELESIPSNKFPGIRSTIGGIGNKALKALPYVGAALGIANTASDIKEHNIPEAAIDAAEMIAPFVGTVAGRAAPFLELLRSTPTQTQEEEETALKQDKFEKMKKYLNKHGLTSDIE